MLKTILILKAENNKACVIDIVADEPAVPYKDTGNVAHNVVEMSVAQSISVEVWSSKSTAYIAVDGTTVCISLTSKYCLG